jgi:hypothetical protein
MVQPEVAHDDALATTAALTNRGVAYLDHPPGAVS